MPASRNNLIWLDMEMSGLHPETDVPLEIATIITDNDLNILAEGPSLVIHQPESVLDGMDAWNTDHHGRSGLTQQVRDSKISLDDAAQQTLAFMQEWTVAGSSPLCGNSIGQDRRFLRKYMPIIDAHLHYRIIDISGIKELSRRWFELEPPPKAESHRALDDIIESIEELRFYRQTVFRSHPGSGE